MAAGARSAVLMPIRTGCTPSCYCGPMICVLRPGERRQIERLPDWALPAGEFRRRAVQPRRLLPCQPSFGIGLRHSPFGEQYSSGIGKLISEAHVFAVHCASGGFVKVAFMSICSREQALLQSVEEITRLIAELHDLRMRVRRAEATALARRHVAVGDQQALAVALDWPRFH